MSDAACHQIDPHLGLLSATDCEEFTGQFQLAEIIKEFDG